MLLITEFIFKTIVTSEVENDVLLSWWHKTRHQIHLVIRSM